jgi:hypothetical protein
VVTALRRIGLIVALAVVIVAVESLAYGLAAANNEWIRWTGWSWPGWNAVTGLATFLAVLVALSLGVWGDELRLWRRRARLSLTFEPHPDHFQKFVTEQGPIYCVRVSVVNDGGRAAKNVEVWAQELQVFNLELEDWVRDPSFMAMNLTRTHVGGTVTPVIHPGIPKPYDLGIVVNPDLSKAAGRTELLFELSTEVPPEKVQPTQLSDSVYPSRKPGGLYRLIVAIAADDVDVVQRAVRIRWDGEWDDNPEYFFNARLRMMPDPYFVGTRRRVLR